MEKNNTTTASPLQAFVASKDKFKVIIANSNIFEASGITLNLNPGNDDDATLSLQGTLQFTEGFRWPTSIASPGVMGIVTYMPKVECFHGIESMDHKINGSMLFDGIEQVGNK
jgi:tocopherol cyclase